MIIKPTRPDWYCWLDADTDWCRANGELPGLQFENIRGRLAVNYHVSHVPCLPEAAVVDHNIVEQARQQNLVLSLSIRTTSKDERAQGGGSR